MNVIPKGRQWLAVRFLLACSLLATFDFDLAAQGFLSVNGTDDSEASIEVTAHDLGQPKRFQRSFDAKNWDDLFVMVPDFEGIAFPDPLSVEEERAFYRLKDFSNEGRQSVSIILDPTDRHLLTLRKGTELEVQLFGTRNEIGLPEKIEEYIIRVGDKTYSASTPPPDTAAAVASDVETGFTWTDDEFRLITGYVFVERNDECPVGSAPPVVDWRVTQVAPGSDDTVVSGRKQARLAPEYGVVEGFDVYSYSVPWFSNGYQVPPPVDDKQFAIDIWSRWIADIQYEVGYPSPPDSRDRQLRAAGARHLALRVGGRLAYPVSILVATYTATVNAQTAAANYDHGPSETYGAFEAAELQVRALIPNGSAKTGWETIPSSAFLSDGPDLIIGPVPCGGGSIVILPDESQIVAEARIQSGDTTRAEEISSTGFNTAGKTASADWSTDSMWGIVWGSATSTVEFNSGTNWMVLDDIHYAEAFNYPRTRVESFAQGTTSVHFMIVPDVPTPPNAKVSCELSIESNSDTPYQGWTESSISTTVAPSTSKARLIRLNTSQTFDLSYNTKYRFSSFFRAGASLTREHLRARTTFRINN